MSQTDRTHSGRVTSADGWERIYDPTDHRKVVYYNRPGEPRYTISRDGEHWRLKRHTEAGEHKSVGLFGTLDGAKACAR